MSRTTKIIMVSVVAILLVCVCVCVGMQLTLQSMGWFLQQSVVTDAGDIEAIGQNIVDYETPSGYAEEFGMSLLGFDVVGITNPDPNSQEMVFMLMQFPAAMQMDEQSMAQQMQQTMQQQTGSGSYSVRTVDQETVTIRDQETTLTISEGSDGSGTDIRQIVGVFPGKGGGVAMLMIVGPIDRWNQAAVDSFIGSMR